MRRRNRYVMPDLFEMVEPVQETLARLLFRS